MLHDNLQPLLDHIEEIMRADYVPSCDDAVSCKLVDKPKITETRIEIQRNTFQVIDVPYSVCNDWNSKQLHQFEDIHGLIFVVSLTDFCKYDQETGSNALQEALDHFEYICNCIWFRQCFPELLKHDDFPEYYGHEKLALVASYLARTISMEAQLLIASDVVELIKSYVKYPCADLDECCDVAITYIREQFRARNHLPNERQIYCWQMNAMDKNDVEKVFHDAVWCFVGCALNQRYGERLW